TAPQVPARGSSLRTAPPPAVTQPSRPVSPPRHRAPSSRPRVVPPPVRHFTLPTAASAARSVQTPVEPTATPPPTRLSVTEMYAKAQDEAAARYSQRGILSGTLHRLHDKVTGHGKKSAGAYAH